MQINYPRNRPRQFAKLGLMVVLFISGFFWTIWLSRVIARHSGLTVDVIAPPLFVGNIIAIYCWSMYEVISFKAKTATDYRHVWTFPVISARDHLWLEENIDPRHYTIHATEGEWPKGESKRLPRDLRVEFHDDDSRVLFSIAR